MTREERAIMYFKDMRKRFCEGYLLGVPKDSVAYKATMAEKEFYDTAIEALKQEPILDKIRAEIKDNRDEWIRGQDPEWHTYDRCLQIIDKHKAESEEE